MERIAVSEIAKQIRGVSYKPDNLHDTLDNNSVILLRANNIDDGKINFDDVVYIDKSKVSKEQYLQKGDILVCASSGSKQLVGKAASVDFDRECTFGAFCKVVRPIPEMADYLGVYFQSSIYRNIISEVSIGANINNIRNEHIDALDIPIRTPAKNAKIVQIINLLQVVIGHRKIELQKLDELIKARFVELFGDIVLNPFNWEKEQLGMVCDVRDGTHDSPQYYETGHPLVTSKNVTGGKIDLTDCSLICEADFNKINERSKIDIGDIIMPMIGTVGKPVIVDVEPNFAIKNVSLIKFKDHSRVLNIFIRALLQSDYFDEAVLSKVRGGTQKFMSLGDIRKLAVIVPPMALQDQFAAFVEQTEKSKLTVQKSLEKLETLKKALMQKYFG